MPLLALDLLPRFDPVAETFAVPFWAVGAVAALLVVFFALAVARSQASRTIGVSVRHAAILIGTLIAAAFVLERSMSRDTLAERRAIEARTAELTMRAITPGSVLACLDSIAGETVETACEKAIFASPETTAAALSYSAARLTLLADGIGYAKRSDPGFERAVVPLRRTVELDRFGLYAQILSLRDGCRPDACEAFALLTDTSQIRANLKGRTFDAYVGRYAGAWSTRNGTPAAGAAAPPLAAVETPPAATSSSAAVSPGTGATNLNFPSAASIPPVSIMNAETAPTPSGNAPAAAEAAASPAPSSTRKQTSSPPRRVSPQGAAPPVQLAPPQPPAASNGAAPRSQ